jgi:hypothetical protein
MKQLIKLIQLMELNESMVMTKRSRLFRKKRVAKTHFTLSRFLISK